METKASKYVGVRWDKRAYSDHGAWRASIGVNGHSVVIATERHDNPGMSVTNAIAEIATQAVTALALVPEETRFIEHYSQESYEQRNPNEPETYDEVTFTWKDRTASNPRWRRLQPQEIAEFTDTDVE